MAANFEKMFKVGNNGELQILQPGGNYGAVVSYGDAGLVAGKDTIGGGVVQNPSDWNATSGVTRILNKPTILDLEAIQDAVAAMFGGVHANATVAYDDAAGTLTITATGGGGTTAEEVQDYMNTALAHANHVGCTVAYDDANNRFVITVAGGGGGDSALSRKIALTVNSQAVSVIISGTGTTAALNAITATPTVDGQTGMVITLGNMGTFKLRAVAVNYNAGANAGSQFTLVAPDPAGAATLNDSCLADMVIYNDAGVINAATLINLSIAGGNLSVQKTGLTAGNGYKIKVTF